jgi:hypothetical protein
MEQLTGTLVKERLGNTGQSEPYLAEKWSVSPDRLIWTFVIRNGLRAEDGTEITAATFKKSLLRRLRRLSSGDNPAPAFDQLKGWEDFGSGKAESLGVYAEGSNLKFTFKRPPDGLLQFLSMPSFGFFSDTNYHTDGTWKSPGSIISSGAYRLIAPISGPSAQIERRSDWPLANPASPSKVDYHFSGWEGVTSIVDSTTVIVGRRRPDFPISNWEHTVIRGAPIFLSALVLSPYKPGPLRDQRFRLWFASQIRENLKGIGERIPDALMSETFYRSSSVKQTPTLEMPKLESPSIPLLFNSDLPPDIEHDAVLESIQATCTQAGLPLKFAPDDRSKPDWLDKKLSSRHFDVRFTNVDIGGAPENWVIRMMFCSKMGVSFPDPSGRICDLVDSYSESGKTVDRDYIQSLDDAIASDGAVIPLFHSGYSWFVGRDISTESFNATTVVPRIDQIRVLD